MRLVLRQSFPLGRFHATLWRANPFDKELAGEWPPSPWRLTRAVVARWYQWRRETAGTWPEDELEGLVRALCGSDYGFYLPEHTRQSIILRQFYPVEFGMDPPNYKSFEAEFAIMNGGHTDESERKIRSIAENAERRGSRLSVNVKKKRAQKQVDEIIGKPIGNWRGLNPDPGARGYSTALAQDNAWCVPPEEDLFWLIEGEGWTPQLIAVLDQCLQRIIYFGRAEALTSICRTDEAQHASANVALSESKASGSLVPVLVPSLDATRIDVERVTQDSLAARNIPQGARLLYARRPPRPPVREVFRRPAARHQTHLVQFALGWAVAPEPRATVRLTARFRAAVLRNLIQMKTGGTSVRWSDAPAGVRDAIAGMTGKDAQGDPLRGPRAHTEFLLWWDGDVPTRLLVWRGARPFDEDEQDSILRAAKQELSWAAAGPDTKAWKIKLIPLDTVVAPPPGFDGESSAVWQSLTPYVPPRHHLRHGNPRPAESIQNQIRRELTLRGGVEAAEMSVQEIKKPSWVAVHLPRRAATNRSFLGDQRGYWLRLQFQSAVSGPLRLGHSSSFGLGLFAPVARSAPCTGADEN